METFEKRLTTKKMSLWFPLNMIFVCKNNNDFVGFFLLFFYINASILLIKVEAKITVFPKTIY